MSILSNLFGGKYRDDQLVTHVQQVLAEDPLLSDPAALTVSSSKGVIRLTGIVHRASEKERIEHLVQVSLRTVGLQYDQLFNEIQVVEARA